MPSRGRAGEDDLPIGVDHGRGALARGVRRRPGDSTARAGARLRAPRALGAKRGLQDVPRGRRQGRRRRPAASAERHEVPRMPRETPRRALLPIVPRTREHAGVGRARPRAPSLRPRTPCAGVERAMCALSRCGGREHAGVASSSHGAMLLLPRARRPMEEPRLRRLPRGFAPRSLATAQPRGARGRLRAGARRAGRLVAGLVRDLPRRALLRVLPRRQRARAPLAYGLRAHRSHWPSSRRLSIAPCRRSPAKSRYLHELSRGRALLRRLPCRTKGLVRWRDGDRAQSPPGGLGAGARRRARSGGQDGPRLVRLVPRRLGRGALCGMPSRGRSRWQSARERLRERQGSAA